MDDDEHKCKVLEIKWTIKSKMLKVNCENLNGEEIKCNNIKVRS